MKARTAALLVGLASLAGALAAPSGALGVELWWFDHDQGRFPTADLPKSVEPGVNSLALIDSDDDKYGPCEKFKLKGVLENRFGGMGEGSITGVSESGFKECPATPEDCKVSKLEPLTEAPWNLALRANKDVALTDVTITLELEGECIGSGLPETEMTISGDVDEEKAEFIPHPEGPEIKFSKAEIGATEVYLDGYMAFGTELTALPEPEGLAAEYSPVELAGHEVAPFAIKRTGRTVECENSSLTGTAEDGDTAVTVEPTYDNCHATVLGSKLPATVAINGCDYALQLESIFVEGETYTYHAPTDLKCPEGKVVEIDVFSNTTEHMANNPMCRYTLNEASNEALETVELTNKAPTEGIAKGWLEAHVEIGGIASKRTVGGVLVCGAETDATGALEGSYVVTGTSDDEEEPVDNGIGVFPN